MPYKDIAKRNAHYRERWRKATPEQRAKHYARVKAWRTPLKRRKEHLKGRYGLTLEQWEAIFEAQGRSCAICSSDHPGWKRGWHTDHDHKSGVVRGILCHVCNRLLGYVKDDKARLQAYIDYLSFEAKPKCNRPNAAAPVTSPS
jgi:hypothetical protein